MASQENDRPQSTSAVRRKSKGKKKVSDYAISTLAGTQSQNVGEVGMLDASWRLIIAPAEIIGFFPATQTINAIMDSIKSFYRDAWSFWFEIPVYDREQMWNHFKTKCAWNPQHDYQIFCNFETNASYMLSDTLCTALEENQKPDWMLEDIWARLNEKWTAENSKFQKMSIQTKAPRAFNKGDLLHIGGLDSIGTHQRKLEKKKRRTMTYDEVIEEKHVKNKKDGHTALVEPPVERTNVGYKKGLDEWRQSQPTSEDDSLTQSPDDDEASILSKKIGGVKKGKARGLGSQHCVGCILYGFVSASLSFSQNQEEIDSEIDSLRRQVEELSKKQKADSLRLARLENLARHLIDKCRSEV